MFDCVEVQSKIKGGLNPRMGGSRKRQRKYCLSWDLNEEGVSKKGGTGRMKYTATRRGLQDEATKIGRGQIMQDFMCYTKEFRQRKE